MEFYEDALKRTQNTTLTIDPNYEESPVFDALRNLQRAISSLALVVLVCLIPYVLYKSRFVRRTEPQEYLFRLLKFLFAAVFVNALGCFILSMIQFSPESWEWCAYLGSIPGFLFTISHAFNYLLFLQRSKITEYTDSILLHRLRLIAMIGAYSMLCFSGFAAVLIRGKLLPDYTCVHTYPWWLGVILLVSDFSLSTVFLLLFVIPVYMHTRAMQASESNSKLIKIARRNLFWSSLTISTTLSYLVCVTTFRFLLEFKQAEVYSYQLFDWIFAPSDLVINSFAAMQITRAVWNPKGSLSQVKPETTKGERISLPSLSAAVRSSARDSLSGDNHIHGVIGVDDKLAGNS